ncbi:MAG: hypothetical protein JNJ54_35330 [Myxococcaceae bacterium]|nr:hypothetical protein [Myxococcaceae bacterium]
MRLVAFCISFVLGLMAACTAPKKCTPATCPGCCSAADTCETGNTPEACGAGGLLCDRCVGAQVCTAGQCEGVTGTGGGSAGGSATGGGTGGSTGELSGTYQELWGWDADGGRTATLADFNRAAVGVWYRDGGAFDFIRGTPSVDGTFVVRNVPAGEITLQLSRRFFVTTNRRLNFDSFTGGRLDAPKATTESQLRLTVRGLEPIGPQNTSGLFFTQQTGLLTNLENAATPVTPAGSTNIESDLDWAAVSRALGYGLPDSAKGDRGWALQFSTTTTDAGTMTALVRSAEFPAISLANGGSTDAVANVTAPMTQPFSIAFDKAAFGALRGSFGRDATAGFFSTQVGTSPSPDPHRYVGQSVFGLASFSMVESAPTPTLAVPSNVFPSTWGRSIFASYTVDQPRALTDGGTPTVFSGGLTMADGPSGFTGMVTPRLGPVRGAQIASRNFIEDQSGVTTTPTISWMAPTGGTVSSYRVSINRIDDSGDVADLWRIYTPNPAVTLPPGILVNGQAYVFELEALSFGQGGISFTLPYLTSSVVSGVIRP